VLPRQLKIRTVRFFYALINPVRRFYWRLFRPKTRGVKCVIEYSGKVLLVRLAYAHDKWTFPGGRVKRGETFEEGAKREVKEEVGINLQQIVNIGEYQGRREYKKDTVQCFWGQVESAFFSIDEMEIAEADWFIPAELPSHRAPTVDIIMQMYLLHLRR
jgi:ADP-ribose pyrophosphatase YjhB (NUDIX family)